MFDFGNKKEIETLKQVIAKLTFENMEKDKTVDYLIGEVNKLSNKVKELEEELEKEKEYYVSCGKFKFKAKKYKDNCLEVENVKYIELKEKITKHNTSMNYDNKIYEISYFTNENDIFNQDKISNMVKNKNIPMYNGIPFRKLQDLYMIMNFLESEKNINYKKETCNIDFTKGLYFKDKKMHFQNIEINNDNIEYTIEKRTEFIYMLETNIELYRTRNILIFNNKEFKNVKELRKLIKEKCYKDKELLISVINNM